MLYICQFWLCIMNSYIFILKLLYQIKLICTFPTDGNPIKATLASPDFITSKPSPWNKNSSKHLLVTTTHHKMADQWSLRTARGVVLGGGGVTSCRSHTLPADFPVGSNNCCLYFASFALSNPRWYSVAVSKIVKNYLSYHQYHWCWVCNLVMSIGWCESIY